MTKSRDKKILKVQEKLYKYFANTSINDIISIKTKEIKTNYLQRPSEEFMVLRLLERDIPGLNGATSIRCIRLDADSPTISNIPKDWIYSINGKELNRQKVWKVAGSSGSNYLVELVGERYTCNCPGFKFRKKCKHSDLIREQNA